MRVVFVAPFFLETTLRFVDAVASLPGVRTALISQDPLDRLPPRLRERLAAHRLVADGLDPRQIADAVRALAAEIGAPSRLLGALEQLQVPLGEVRDALGIEGMGAETARNFRDKGRMKEVLARAGVPCARHARVTDEASALEFAGRVGFPLVIKPAAGAGAKGTFRVGDGDELRAALAASRPAPDRPAVIEEFVTGEEFSFDTVSIRGRPVWHSLSHYLPAPLHVVDHPWIQWCVLIPREIDHPRYDDIRSVAARALAALGMDTGLSHMEWFRRRDGGVLISEVGARPPGAQITSLISWAHDMDFYRAWARLVALDQFEPPQRRFAAGCAYLRGQGRGRVRAVVGLDRVLARLGPIVVESRPPAIGASPSSSYEGDGFVIVRHPETAVVERALKALITEVRVELG
ncbi:MAG: ATP-grasp domain-containing protein [Thermoanaerobaculia bacterium]|nr:MAG: ATP-grasp domain-containing protein [Thermoanaerobaculia bacterium]